MALFAPRFFTSGTPAAEPNFNGLFRMLNDFDRYANEVRGDNELNTNNDVSGNDKSGKQITDNVNRRNPRQSLALPFFSPKFDLKETETTYVLQGELPGIDKKDVHIEFLEPQTVRVFGEVVRNYESHGPNSAGDAKDKDKNNKDDDKKTLSAAVKYWVSERSVGAFSRTFSFPEQVDHEEVTATLRDGVLYLAVPKAKKVQGGKRITVS